MVVELAWAAGVFDGEGSTSYFKSKGWVGPRISVPQNGLELLERFKAAVQCGKIYEHTTRPGMYQWTCQTKEGTEDVLNKLWPFLSNPKKLQALKVMEMVETNRIERQVKRGSPSQKK